MPRAVPPYAPQLPHIPFQPPICQRNGCSRLPREFMPRLPLRLCSLAPSRPMTTPVSLQMWALWRAWPITVAGTLSTGQATQHPPSPATQ